MKKLLTSIMICSILLTGLAVFGPNLQAQEKGKKAAAPKTESVKKAESKNSVKKGKTKAAKTPKIDPAKLPKVETGPFLAVEKKAGSGPVSDGLKMKPMSLRLPIFFKGLNLTEEQTLKIHAIQKEYIETITALRLRADRLNQERADLCEKILTPAQKDELKKLKSERPKSEKAPSTRKSPQKTQN